MLHPTIGRSIYDLRAENKNQMILVYLLRIYDLYCQTYINLNLDIETVYKLLIEH